MKSFFALSLIMFSSISMAQESRLLLDASCKVECLVATEIIGANQGGVMTRQKTEMKYFDIQGRTRSQIDDRTSQESLNALCKRTFNPEASALKSDCLYFKN